MEAGPLAPGPSCFISEFIERKPLILLGPRRQHQTRQTCPSNRRTAQPQKSSSRWHSTSQGSKARKGVDHHAEHGDGPGFPQVPCWERGESSWGIVGVQLRSLPSWGASHCSVPPNPAGHFQENLQLCASLPLPSHPL